MLNKRNWWNVGTVAALALVALFAVAPASAQEQVGAIQGTVSDASGAVLPGATVEFEVAEPRSGPGYVARPSAGRLDSLGGGRWAWSAPRSDGCFANTVPACSAPGSNHDFC